MRWSKLLAYTRRDPPADAVVASHQWLERGGMIRKVSAGIYNYYPLMVRVLRKIERIVRQEMDAAGAQEILMPAVQPAELWKQSGRWEHYGRELLRFKDRKQMDFVLGPTHEEVVSAIVAQEVESYRQLPLNLYQIQTKFRDEIRPRFGLMRGREFIMKDAYSFDVDEAGANASYDAMYAAYRRIFTRCGLTFRAVEADTGAIGGNRSHEFQVLAASGEDEIISCDHCDYAANVEKAEVAVEAVAAVSPTNAPAPELLPTPGRRTIEEVSEFLGISTRRTVKTLIFVDDGGRFHAAAIRGDLNVNPLKLKAALGVGAVHPADDKDIGALGFHLGYIGPQGIPPSVSLVIDPSVQGIEAPVVGANQPDAHMTHVYPGRDYTPALVADLRQAEAGDVCPRCGTGRFRKDRGIEVGHVFFLGDKYSRSMNVTFMAEDKTRRHAVMGCYGIGVSRTAAAAIEQNHDADGIIWPMPIAPFQVVVTPVLYKDAAKAEAERIYDELKAAGIEVLLDDRDERPGVKFKDADLIGIPLRVVVGDRGIKEGKAELKARRAAQAEAVPLEDIVARVRATVAVELAGTPNGDRASPGGSTGE